MQNAVKNLSAVLRSKGLKLATAESCTGGMIASAMTDLAGSSELFDRGFITYSNQAKMDMLGVSPATLDQFGAVSEQTAAEMAAGAIKCSLADYAIAVTGIAGPSGGTTEKPVGLVYIAFCKRGFDPVVTRNLFSGERADIRQQTVIVGLRHLLSLIQKEDIAI